MKTFISILRGINVGGQRPVKMQELKKLYEALGFFDVLTYIQSGNVIFKAEDYLNLKDLSVKIENAILQEYGFNVPVIIRTVEELKAILQANPFHHADGTVADKIYITFLENEPLPSDIARIKPFDFRPDRFVIKGKEIFIDCAGGYGTTRLSNTFFENKLKVRATTRNWKTVQTLLEMANK